MAVRKALAHQPGSNNLTWGQYVIDAASGSTPPPPADAATAAAAEHPAVETTPLADRWVDDRKV
jgi:hypothetical protein